MKLYASALKTLKVNNPHLFKYRGGRIRSFLLKLAAIEAVIILAAFLGRERIELLLWFWVPIGIVLPVLILKPQKIFRPRRFGTITELAYKQQRYDITKNTSRAGSPNFISNTRVATAVSFELTEPNGKLRSFELMRRYEKVYRAGDTVIRVTGIDYPINLTPHGQVACPRCGTIIPAEDERCFECRMEKINLHVNRFDVSDGH